MKISNTSRRAPKILVKTKTGNVTVLRQTSFSIAIERGS